MTLSPAVLSRRPAEEAIIISDSKNLYYRRCFIPMIPKDKPSQHVLSQPHCPSIHNPARARVQHSKPSPQDTENRPLPTPEMTPPLTRTTRILNVCGEIKACLRRRNRQENAPVAGCGLGAEREIFESSALRKAYPSLRRVHFCNTRTHVTGTLF